MKSLASKLCKIQGECAYVQKDGKNEFHRYKYASAANVLEKVNDACVANNVASFPVYQILSEKDRPTKSGGVETLVTVQVALTIIDGDSDDQITPIALGSGQDAGDKAVAKAQTMALKYAWMTTLNISTGDDPEADEETDKRNAEKGKPALASKPHISPPPIPTSTPAAQKTPPAIEWPNFWAKVDSLGLDKAAVCTAYAKAKKVASVESIEQYIENQEQLDNFYGYLAKGVKKSA